MMYNHGPHRIRSNADTPQVIMKDRNMNTHRKYELKHETANIASRHEGRRMKRLQASLLVKQ